MLALAGRDGGGEAYPVGSAVGAKDNGGARRMPRMGGR